MTVPRSTAGIRVGIADFTTFNKSASADVASGIILANLHACIKERQL